jgi:ParB family chromosome partitioning protein
MDESEAAEIALVENIQREDLNPVDEALAYKALMFKYGLSSEEVSERVGKDRSTVANLLRILSLPKQILDSVSRETISEGHARVLVGIEDVDVQISLWKRIVEHGISVRQTEELARSIRRAPRRARRGRVKDPNLAATEEQLQKVFGTKVRISGSGKRGKIEIEYYSQSELERLLDLMSAIELGS